MGIDNAEALISAAVADATGGGESEGGEDIGGGDEGSTEVLDSSSDSSEGSEGDGVADSGDAGGDGVGDESAEGVGEEAVEVVETPEQTAAREKVEKEDAILAAIGFNKPKEGQRDNRIPHSRVRKILLNGLEKHTAPIRMELDGLKTEVEGLRATKAGADRFDQMIAQGDERLIHWLAEQNPAFKKFVEPQKAVPAQPEEFTEKMPGPDAEDKDGNPMYSPEQWEKFTDWQARKAEHAAEKRLLAKMNERLTPFEREAKARAAYQERAQRIHNEVEAVKKTWGDLLPADGTKESREVMALMTKNPGMTFAQAAAAYIIPKLRQDRNSMRQSILAELKKAPKAVSKGAPGAGTKATVTKGPDEKTSTEDVIRQSLREAGLSQE
jgi:hypothetical protein